MLKRLAVLVVLLSGCDMYFGGHGGDDVCNDSGGGTIAVPPEQQLRDPQTGQCEYQGGGDWQCGPCGPCAETGGAPAAMPDWAVCYGACESITDAATCEATPSCHAAFLIDATALQPAFYGCFEMPPSGPVEGSCAGLDAHECSRHDDCVSNYLGNSPSSVPSFDSCSAEPGPQSCASVDCGTGAHCEEQCYPSDRPGPAGWMDSCSAVCVPDQTCAVIDCGPGYTCSEVCTAGTSGQPGACSPTCVPVDSGPGECTGSVTCAAAPPACPASATPGIANGCYTGYCIPLAECGPHDPGACTGAVTCGAAPPACPAGTVAGIRNGCWSGYCIPTQACPAPACEALTTEAACTARTDCLPVYDGTDCTCYPDHCECQVLTYARCESRVQPL